MLLCQNEDGEAVLDLGLGQVVCLEDGAHHVLHSRVVGAQDHSQVHVRPVRVDEQHMSLGVSTVLVEEIFQEVGDGSGCDVPAHQHVPRHSGGVKPAPLRAMVVVND